MFYITYLTLYNVQLHICAIIVWLCACTGDNPRAKARGLSSYTYAQTQTYIGFRRGNDRKTIISKIY